MQDQGTPVLNMAIGSPDQAPPEAVVKVLQETAVQQDVHGYQNYRGVPELREAMSSWMGRTFGVAPDPAHQLLPLMGAKEGIFHLSMAYLDPGDEVLVPDPGYPTYASAARLAGGTPRSYDLRPENGWQPDVEALKKEDLAKVKLMWVNSPHMPTGTRLDQGAFRALIGLARQEGFLLCHDNPYALVLNDRPLSLFDVEEAWDVGVELHSMSKAFNMAGWRVGWMCSSSEVLEQVVRVKTNMDSGMFLGIQKAAVEALQQPASWYEDLNKTYRERREVVHRMLDHLGCTYDPDTAGMFIWAAIPDHVADGFTFSDELLHGTHVFAAPGGVFGKNGERFIRFSLCSPLAIIKEAEKRIHAFQPERSSSL